MRIVSVLYCSFILTNLLTFRSCPCDDLSLKQSYLLNKPIVCIVGNSSALSILKTNPLNYAFMIKFGNTTGCDLIVTIVHKIPKRMICPGICTPQVIELPSKWLQHIPDDSSQAITCSLTFGMFRQMTDKSVVENDYVSALIDSILWRRLAECSETIHWKNKYMSLTPVRRPISALIIWVGSASRKSLGILQQQSTLLSNPFHGTNGVIGWSVDEDLFPCRNGSTRCYTADKQGHYLHTMPLTYLGDERCNSGWACAQRRPLRALSHALLLFEPEILFLCDDDTYVNYPLLEKSLGNLLSKDSNKSPVIIGNFIAPRYGQISPRGFLLGGAGYLLGKCALQRLVAHEVSEFPYARPNNARGQAHHLSILSEIRRFQKGNHTCQRNCLLADKSNGGVFPISNRLIDMCTNLLAGEHTCHHSDHSVSRCLFYGFFSHPIGLPCGFQATPAEVKKGVPLMCGHVISHCNLSRHISCHRWHPSSLTDSTPVIMPYNHTKWVGCLPE